MKKLNFLLLVLFSLSMSSCGFQLYLPTDDGGSTTNQQPSSGKTSPAPETPIESPTPSNRGTTDRSNDDENAALYAKLNLTNSQIQQFEDIIDKYELKTRKAELKYKAKQSVLRQELKNIAQQREDEIKGMMSDSQYQNYLNVMNEGKGKAKGSIGG